MPESGWPVMLVPMALAEITTAAETSMTSFCRLATRCFVSISPSRYPRA